MSETKESPYFQMGEWQTNSAAYQISQVVRSGSDARRMLVPIHEWTELCNERHVAHALEQLLQSWDRSEFLQDAERAQHLLEELDRFWTDCKAIDMMDLGERRVVLNALSHAIDQRCEVLKRTSGEEADRAGAASLSSPDLCPSKVVKEAI